METVLREASLLELVLHLARRRRVATVQGESMLPLLAPGDRVLFDPHAYRDRLPSEGDLVVARSPTDRARLLVKQVRWSRFEEGVWLEGANRDASTDSRHHGAVPRALVLGRVTARLPL